MEVHGLTVFVLQTVTVQDYGVVTLQRWNDHVPSDHGGDTVVRPQ